MTRPDDRSASLSSTMYDVNANDPNSVLMDRSAMSADDVAQISGLMGAIGRLRVAEQKLSEASQRYMKLGRTDMRALHYLSVARHTGTIVTPSAIANHLGISSASTTKLLDRLERAGHIERAPHPSDRRALTISITEDTHKAAMETVGQVQSKRFHAAARLTPQEREIVTRFLDDMAEQITLRGEGWQTAGDSR